MDRENTKEVKETKFKSPVPVLKQVRNGLLGRKKPDIFTQITFWIGLCVSVIFLIWSVLGYVAISSSEWIQTEKGIDIEKIIDVRGEQLGFISGEFSNRLITFNGIATICWAIVILGLLFLYRKKMTYTYLVFGAFVFYLGMAFFYLGFGYFVHDITFTDKVMLLILLVSFIAHAIFLRSEKQGKHISFFGEENEDL